MQKSLMDPAPFDKTHDVKTIRKRVITEQPDKRGGVDTDKYKKPTTESTEDTENFNHEDTNPPKADTKGTEKLILISCFLKFRTFVMYFFYENLCISIAN
jgi:hypothetical protein